MEFYLGFFVGLVVIIILSIYKRGKNKEYDERQKIIIGRAYKYGYAILLISIFLFNFLSYKYNLDMLLIPFYCMIISYLFISVYLIYHDSFLYLRGNYKKSIFTLITIAILNIIIYLFAGYHKINLIAGLYLIIVSLTLYLKEKNGENKDE